MKFSMNKKICYYVFLASLLLLITGCDPFTNDDPHGDQHGEVPASTFDKGPHGGRVLSEGSFTVELAIFEAGVPPEYRAWVRYNGQALAPDEVQLSVVLTRLDGEQNTFHFTPHEDFLRGDGVVTEPHSFDVAVVATYAGNTYGWSYASYEGRVTITEPSAQEAPIVVEPAGPRVIHDLLPLYGRVVVNPDAIRELGARFAGEVKSVNVAVGDLVQAGDLLARVEANDSLQVYSVTAPITGTVTARLTNPGQQVGDTALFIISDLTQLWVELSVFPRDLGRLRVDQTVHLHSPNGADGATGRIVRMAPGGTGAGHAVPVWVAFDNSNSNWIPGLYVNAEVKTGGAPVPLAVRVSGLQTFRDFTVVFERVGETYEVRMLELGRSDGEYVEVLSGLKPGAEYVSGNSYLIKADIEKSGASHDH